jgi:parvulin-like peptidyl-prolyl isomerase
MHRDSRPSGSKLRAPDWAPDKVPTRSAEEAYRIATTVKERAQANPTEFAQIARELSDDVVTRTNGGSLGGERAAHLPAPFLDALTAMRAGEISEVIQTQLGFHVLLKRAPPPLETVRGVRLVVRYSGTVGVYPPKRSREDALALAQSLAQRARSGVAFSKLISEFSEDRDRIRGGNMGVWRTTDPAPEPLTTEVLARLKVGEVSDPIDTPHGFQVLQRVALAPGATFAMRSVRMVYTRNSPESEALAARTAAEITDGLRADPLQFASYQARYCCSGTELWQDGQGDAEITNLVESLGIGEIARAALKLPAYYLVVQRLDPDLLEPAKAPVFALPTPIFANIEAAVATSASKALADSVGQLRSVLGFVKLSQAEKAVVEAGLVQFQKEVVKAQTADERIAACRAALAIVHDGISEATYGAVITRLEGWLTMQILANPSVE